MSEPTICCQKLVGAQNALSPFQKVIALDYHDGPTAGLLQCKECSRAYRFNMVSWDDGQNVRIFTLALLPEGSFAQLESAYAQHQAPIWPLWVPRWEFPSDDAKHTLESRTEEVLGRAGPPQLVLASEDLSNRILLGKAITSQTIATVRDWFAFLGLSKLSASA